MKLTVTSIASFLPSVTKYDNDAFGGTVAHNGRMTLTPMQEVNASKLEAEKQLEDADKRNVVWSADDDAELGDADAIGDDDPDYDPHVGYVYKESDSTPALLGVRGQGGTINALPVDGGSIKEARYSGVCERVPTNLREMVRLQKLQEKQVHVLSMKAAEHIEASLEETQPLFFTPKIKSRFCRNSNLKAI